MKKRDVYPTKYFKAADFPDQPKVLQVEMTRTETFENNGKSVEKLVLYFHGQKSGLPIGPTLWDQIAAVVEADGVDKFDSDDTTKWPGHWLELFRDKTSFGSEMVSCIRVRKPATPPPKTKKSKPKSDLDDDTSF